ncbi:hypothetical protein FQA47_021277 [Oryzias melastigma]|uniref:Uncharacterized protein n=1 Tax=Oryzias melastigma TaxID=30732 RepID=A0A834KZE0_ORYME|nr:hypothetical protein FQA47_021277 [Oryzias melastigma]
MGTFMSAQPGSVETAWDKDGRGKRKPTTSRCHAGNQLTLTAVYLRLSAASRRTDRGEKGGSTGEAPLFPVTLLNKSASVRSGSSSTTFRTGGFAITCRLDTDKEQSRLRVRLAADAEVTTSQCLLHGLLAQTEQQG